MMKVAIYNCHPGYHHELLSSPPRGVRYEIFTKMFMTFPERAVFGKGDWRPSIQFGWSHQEIGDIPYYPKGPKLIHAYFLPVVNKVPFVFDTDYFYYPFAVDLSAFERVKAAKAPFQGFSRMTPAVKSRLARSRELLDSPWCRKILPWSRWCEASILKCLPFDGIRRKTEVMYPAVANAAFKRRVKGEARRLLYVSGMGGSYMRKGGDDMLKAFAKLRRRFKKLELVFVGHVPETEAGKYSKGVSFIPSLPKERLFSLYARSDIFVQPSRCESFAISLLEAMNYSLPVVTTKGPCLPVSAEIVEDGVSGFLVERRAGGQDPFAGELDQSGFVSALSRLIENGDLRRRMGQAAKAEVAEGKFCLEKRNMRLRRIYEESLDPR